MLYTCNKAIGVGSRGNTATRLHLVVVLPLGPIPSCYITQLADTDATYLCIPAAWKENIVSTLHSDHICPGINHSHCGTAV